MIWANLEGDLGTILDQFWADFRADFRANLRPILVGRGGNRPFFSDGLSYSRIFFFMTNPMVIFIFYFGDVLSKFSFCLNSLLKIQKFLKKNNLI